MNSPISKKEKIDYALNLLGNERVNNIEKFLNDKYGKSFDHSMVILEMITLNLIDRITHPPIDMGIPVAPCYTLTKLGREILNDGGYLKYEQKRKEENYIKEELAKENLLVAQKTRKNMGWQMVLAVIGGMSGLFALYLQLSQGPQNRIESPSTEVQKTHQQLNNKTKVIYDSTTFENVNEDSVKK